MDLNCKSTVEIIRANVIKVMLREKAKIRQLHDDEFAQNDPSQVQIIGTGRLHYVHQMMAIPKAHMDYLLQWTNRTKENARALGLHYAGSTPPEDRYVKDTVDWIKDTSLWEPHIPGTKQQ